MDKEPIRKKPEGMTFEDVEELKPGEVDIVAEVFADRDQIKLSTARAFACVKAATDQDGELAELEVGEVVADRGRISTKRIPDIPFPSPEPRMQFRPLQNISDRELIALACVMKPGDVGIVAVPLDPADRVTLLTLLVKGSAKKRAGRRRG